MLRAHQLARLNALLAEVLPKNRFYAQKLAGLAAPLQSLDELGAIPFTTKEELAAPAGAAGSSAASTEFGAANLTYPLDRYVRFHQTSGTSGAPLAVPRSWS